MVMAYAQSVDAADPYISPVFGKFEDLPPMMIQVGTEEVLYDDSTRVVEGIESASGSVEFPPLARHDARLAPACRRRPRSRRGYRRAGCLHFRADVAVSPDQLAARRAPKVRSCWVPAPREHSMCLFHRV